jgi:hypothetical protein
MPSLLSDKATKEEGAPLIYIIAFDKQDPKKALFTISSDPAV